MPFRVSVAFLMLGLGGPMLAAQELFPSPSLVQTGQGLSHLRKTFANLKGFEDVRFCRIQTKVSDGVLRTLTFNRNTGWPEGTGSLPEAVLVDGANPGLGVRELHRQGHTGQGVAIAIIDQNLAGDHPEFAGKLRKYVDLGCEQDPESGSMHGPAVTSLLVGTHLGTAPGALVDYYAVPAWKADAGYLARALDQIVAGNGKLPEALRVRAVSVSAAPSGPGSPFTKNGRLWDVAVAKAREAGILVIDCTEDRGFVSSGYFDPRDPDNLEAFSAGWPGRPERPGLPPSLHAPSSYRTVAEEYVSGEPSYQYTGVGGLSWAIPYVTGVAALVWQENPDITAVDMQRLLFETAYHTQAGVAVVDAARAIEKARALKREPRT